MALQMNVCNGCSLLQLTLEINTLLRKRMSNIYLKVTIE